ncbi:hypothetical protein CTI12_AA531490 [Artemisia annua]|uniref:Uncharacterized protein n=1 Tax=Artemisia annua TaxID=35608 RepID=A0A2U1L4E7_ARTAN|nr:hypothetical protein CTI12_AA531490 [Artemisia annua]
MAILNKKSMLFLLATILLICSSYADDHLSSARRELRTLFNSGKFNIRFGNTNLPYDIHKLTKYKERIDKSQDLLEESLEQIIEKHKEKDEVSKKEIEKLYAHFNKICTDFYHCKPSDKCRGTLCASKYYYKLKLDCKTECGGKE